MNNRDIGAARDYHESTKLAYINLANKPPLYKSYPGLPEFPLPTGFTPPQTPTLEACHLLRDDVASAQSEIQAVLDLAPGANVSGLLTAEEHHLFAGRLVQTGHAELAVEHYAASVGLAPEVYESRYNFGGLLRRLGSNEEAIEQLRVAAEIAPTDADTRIELGLAYGAIGRNAEAIESLRRAIELDPSSPESQAHLPGLIRELEAGLD